MEWYYWHAKNMEQVSCSFPKVTVQCTILGIQMQNWGTTII